MGGPVDGKMSTVTWQLLPAGTTCGQIARRSRVMSLESRSRDCDLRSRQ